MATLIYEELAQYIEVFITKVIRFNTVFQDRLADVRTAAQELCGFTKRSKSKIWELYSEMKEEISRQIFQLVKYKNVGKLKKF